MDFNYSEKEAWEMSRACMAQSKSGVPEHLKERLIEVGASLYMGKITKEEATKKCYEIANAGAN